MVVSVANKEGQTLTYGSIFEWFGGLRIAGMTLPPLPSSLPSSPASLHSIPHCNLNQRDEPNDFLSQGFE
jgi:hypothetical protein